MGKEKALLEAGGESLIERSLARLAASFAELVVSVGPDGGSRGLREAVERFEARSERRVGLVKDRLHDVGPLAGIDACLRAIHGQRAFFVAVDLPRICIRLADLLWEEAARRDCPGCMPSLGGRPEPVYAVYTRALVRRLPELIAAGQLSLRELCRLEGFRVVDLNERRWQDRVLAAELDPGARAARLDRLFRNINTPEDYRKWADEAGR